MNIYFNINILIKLILATLPTLYSDIAVVFS